MTEDDPTPQADNGEAPVVIRKYANRRLYNTGTTEFVTLDDIRKLVVAGERFVVVDAKTGRDITSSILAQIVAEQETRGDALLPHEVLRQIISAYEEGASAQLSDYLKSSMEIFTNNWKRLDRFGEIGRQNLEVLRKSMTTMFAPPMAGRASADSNGSADSGGKADRDDLADQVSDLKEEIRDLQRQLQEVASPAPAKKPRSRRRKS